MTGHIRTSSAINLGKGRHAPLLTMGMVISFLCIASPAVSAEDSGVSPATTAQINAPEQRTTESNAKIQAEAEAKAAQIKAEAAATALEAKADEEADKKVADAGGEAVAKDLNKKMDKVLGATAESDYVAKHFSFLFGGVVLNQFRIQTDENDAETENDDQFFLEPGNTDAKAFLELGFRWRWAWLDRDSYLESRSRAPQYNDKRLAVRSAIAQRQAAQTALDAAEAAAAAKEAADNAEGPKDDAGTGADSAGAVVAPKAPGAVAAPKKTAAKTTAKGAPAKEEAKPTPDPVKEAEQALSNARIAERVARNALNTAVNADAGRNGDYGVSDSYFSLCDRWKTRGGRFFIPDDWAVRLGFVFDSNNSSNDVVSTVGASDLYGELGFGWNIVQWSFPTSSIAREPLRGTINFDVDGMFFTDENINDVHGRGIFGPSFVFGIPVKYTTPDPRREVDPTVVENDPVIELLARFGAVMAEVPQFKGNDTDELKREHNQVRYGTDWGFGLDVEFNVPITQKLGYIMARGQINADFDPNPWFISLGYTIPLSTITSAITSGGGS